MRRRGGLRPSAAASGLGQGLILAAAMIAWATAAIGCRATIAPPADPARPVPAYLIDYGRTSAVAIPAAHGERDPGAHDDAAPRLIRYVYGDWRWYALRQTGSWGGLRAIAWPTTAALGRGELAAPAAGDAESLRRTLDAQQVLEVMVDRDRVDALREQLDAMHAELGAAGPRTYALDLVFVQHPRNYTLWHNSNHQSAAWLEELGCRVRGPTILSRWRLAPVAEERAASRPGAAGTAGDRDEP